MGGSIRPEGGLIWGLYDKPEVVGDLWWSYLWGYSTAWVYASECPSCDRDSTFGDLGAWVVSNNPVPIPGAVWLFGSGLIGLVGIKRKFKK